VIRRLPPEVAVRIAAGEVIERPFSAVKELLENALDAGARRVTIALISGGAGSLVVEDDGGGIPPEELPLAVERYATSKISEENDLLALRTLGFRGEALASLGAVGRMEIRSRVPGTPDGAFLRLEGGIVVGHGIIPCAPGTRIQVDDLFFNVPARRKFLKGAPAETRRVVGVARDYALAYPAVAFLVLSEGKKIFSSSGEGDRRALLRQLWGSEPETRFAAVHVNSVRLEAFYQPSSGGSAPHLTAFVNGRRFFDPLLRAALASVPGSGGGEWFLSLAVPPGELDVNIHPAKVEVRFRCSRDVFDALREGAKELLADPPTIPLPGKREGPFVTPPIASLPFRPAAMTFDRVASSKGSEGSAPPQECRDQGVLSSLAKPPSDPQDPHEECRYLGQMVAGFLIFEDSHGLIVMDPHAAHERVRYEALGTERGGDATQALAWPLPLPPSLGLRVAPLETILKNLGFLLEEGEGGWSLKGFPVHPRVTPPPPLDFLRRVVDSLEREEASPLEILWRTWASLACAGAVKLGESMDAAEARALWRHLQQCAHPEACPHGRPTLLRLETTSLTRHFRR